MPNIDAVIHSISSSYEHPLDKIAGAVLAMAVYDATNNFRKTNRNNYHHRIYRQNQCEAARRWLRFHGIYWLEALNIDSDLILEVICDD